MTRSTKEWIGKTDDSQPPPRVRLRVFLRHNGICHIAGRKIEPGEPWAVDHVVALVNGGENRESNLAPILVDKHKAKTRDDVAIKAKTYRKRKANYGIRTRSRWPYGKDSPFKKKISGAVVRRK